MKNKILIVDDEVNVIAALKRALADEPLEVFTAISAEQGLQILKRQNFKIVISDERMPGMDGSEFLSVVKTAYPETVRIMLTGHASLGEMMNAINRGEVFRFFVKPWNDLEIIMAIRFALEKFELEAENRRLLKTIRNQSVELKVIERKYAGITRLEKDADGNVCLADFAEDEIAAILAECNMQSSP
jgi:two-component system, probable response regulator PhcQ